MAWAATEVIVLQPVPFSQFQTDRLSFIGFSTRE
jgi:hypothetical protein